MRGVSPAGSSVPSDFEIFTERQITGRGDLLITDLIGKKYGRLEVVGRAQDRILPSGKKEVMWICKCECGNFKNVRAESLKRGNTISCGCYRKEYSQKRARNRTKHGFGGQKIYKVWKSMIDRCENPKNKSYKNYGEVGISVCDEWRSVDNFVKWAQKAGYKEGLTLERVDNSCGYNPNNCIWADRYTQNNHTSRNHMLEYKGKTQTIAQWAREFNISYCALKSRINKYGWSVEVALETPVK